MKFPPLPAVFALAALGGTSLHAADIPKADNTTALNVGTSWVGGNVPGAGDVALYDNTVTAARSAAIGSNLSWLGIRVANPGGTQTIATTAGSTLTLGSSGIDMSAATADLSISAVMNLAVPQTWSIASGRNLTLSGANTGAGPVNVAGPGSITLGVGGGLTAGAVVSGPFGTGTVSLGGGVRVAYTSNRTLYNPVNLNSDITTSGSGALGFSGGMTVAAGNQTITVVNPTSTLNGSSVTFGGTVGGTFSQINGPGTLVLANGNAVASPIVFVRDSSGSANDYAVINTNLTIGSGVSFVAASGGLFTTSTNLTVNAGGFLNTSNNSGIASALTVASLSGGGTIFNGTPGATTATLTIDGGTGTGTSTFSGTITPALGVAASALAARGDTAVVKTGSTTQVFSGANTYTGSTTVSGGTLQVGNSSALGFGGFIRGTTIPGTTVSSGTVDLNGTTGVNEPVTLSGNGAGGNGALVNNAGTAARIENGVAGLTLTSGGNNYTTAPNVVIAGTGTGATAVTTLGVSSATFTVNGGTTVYSTAPTVTITGAGTGATATAVLTGGVVTGITISNPGFGYSGTPTITFSGGTVTTAGTNPTGVGSPDAYTVSGVALTSGGTGYTGATTYTFDAGNATGAVVLSSVNLTADSSMGGSGDMTINAVVSNTGTRALTKVGTGILSLAGANTYTGATTVSGGTLLALNTGATSATGTGAVAVNTGARLGGTGRVSGAVTVAGGAILLGGDGVSTVSGLTLAANPTLAIGSVIELTLGTGGRAFLSYPGSSGLQRLRSQPGFHAG